LANPLAGGVRVSGMMVSFCYSGSSVSRPEIDLR